MTTQEFIEAKREEYKTMHADVFGGKLSPLYADDWLETYTTELVAMVRDVEQEKSIKALLMAIDDAEHGDKEFGLQYFSSLAQIHKICDAQTIIKRKALTKHT